ncbi:TPT domain-containing protein, partial [Haematococcus lacustris]
MLLTCSAGISEQGAGGGGGHHPLQGSDHGPQPHQHRGGPAGRRHLCGSLNKVLVAVAGIILFREVTTVRNLTSIAVGLLAGVIFVFAKAYQPAPSKH